MPPSSHGRAGQSLLAGFRARTVLLTLLAVLMVGLARLCVFTVGTGEFAVVTAFGKPVQVIRTPGLAFKYPYQSVNRFDRRLFVYTPPISEFLTLEKSAVVASGVVLWRIAEPRQFFETVFDRMGAESRLGDILFAELGAAIGRNPLTRFVAIEPEDYQAEAILDEVVANCREVALRDYGIEVVDVQLQRFDFPERNRLRVYARMKSERAGISMKARSEGEEEGLKIRAAADEQKARILAEAFKVSEQHRGAGEAEAARIYAEALGEAPEFYRFLRSMEASRKFIRKDTTLVLPAGSELFRLLHGSRDADQEATDLADRPQEGAPP
jgi:membrane protease subunit HflC